MGWDYVMNNGCTLAKNNAWDNTYLEGNRKALITELFFVFLLYFITQCLHAFRYKNNQANPNSLRQSLMAVRISQLRASGSNSSNNLAPVTEDTRPELPWHEKRWNRTFAYIFSSHSVALGMVLLFSPLAGAIIVAYMHLLFFIIFFVFEVKLKITLGKIMRILMDIMNLTLLIIGTVGINYNQSYTYTQNGF